MTIDSFNNHQAMLNLAQISGPEAPGFADYAELMKIAFDSSDILRTHQPALRKAIDAEIQQLSSQISPASTDKEISRAHRQAKVNLQKAVVELMNEAFDGTSDPGSVKASDGEMPQNSPASA